MNMKIFSIITAMFWFLLTMIGPVDAQDDVDKETSDPVVVQLVQNNDSWQLVRDGEPYYVHGGGGGGPLDLLADAGANSTRTWGVDDVDEVRQRLDECHRHGLSVAFGIWLEHERHGHDYDDDEFLAEQAETVLGHVRTFKDHPAILVWGIGNEMEGDGSNPKVWKHVEEVCRRVQEEDANHPVMTVIAEIGEDKIKSIESLCPSVDIIGINSYGGSRSLPKRYREQGGTRPYIVTEFGPVGTWEVPKNDIGAIIEPTSTKKSDMYLNAHAGFTADKEHCLGSYAFLWGDKQEGTATWFGMLLPDGTKTAASDVMSEIWSGEPPKNRCPVIESITVAEGDEFEPGGRAHVSIELSDPDGDQPKVRWVVMAEASSYVTGGDFQETPGEVADAIVSCDSTSAEIQLPDDAGIFRIYAYAVDDTHGNAATANVPVRVNAGPVK